jgi:uncharacterized protein (TIGR02449 family)
METAELIELEMQVQSLIEMVESLQSENNSLRQRIATATQDRSVLQERHHDAAKRIKSIINELKEEIDE